MSHYQSFKNSSQIKKYNSENPAHYLNKKRTEHDMDSSIKKRYEYEDKYDHYDKYDKYNDRYTDKYNDKYNQKYNIPYNKYRGKDYYYSNQSKYHGPKSPRRDYKKSYQKYSNDNEGIRNLSHCDIPSPVKKKDECSENPLTGYTLIRGFQNQQGTYQHIFQNQQNINISIISPKPILDSSQCCDKRVISVINSGLNKRRYSNSPKKEENANSSLNGNLTNPSISYKDPDESLFNSPDKKYRSSIPKPPPKVPLQILDKTQFEIPENPFIKDEPLPMIDYAPLSANANNSHTDKAIIPVKLEPNYLLSQITNKDLVNSFVDPASLNHITYDSIAPYNKSDSKFYLVYDEKYENSVDKITEANKAEKEKIKEKINSLLQEIDKSEYDIRKIKYKIYENDWKYNKLNAKIKAIDSALEEFKKNE